LGLVRLAAAGATEDALVGRFRKADDSELTAVALAQLAAIVGRAIARAAALPPDAVDQVIAALDASFDGDQIVFYRAADQLN
jgi:hypothetical protein